MIFSWGKNRFLRLFGLRQQGDRNHVRTRILRVDFLNNCMTWQLIFWVKYASRIWERSVLASLDQLTIRKSGLSRKWHFYSISFYDTLFEFWWFSRKIAKIRKNRKIYEISSKWPFVHRKTGSFFNLIKWSLVCPNSASTLVPHLREKRLSDYRCERHLSCRQQSPNPSFRPTPPSVIALGECPSSWVWAGG